MNIGIVTHWFNRGQGTVGRHVRSILGGLGHRTFVLARPTKDRFVRPRFVDQTDVWDQPGITIASAYDIPADEYVSWAQAHRLDAAFFDQNYQFDEIAQLRERGVRTIGRFVWESFAPKHVGDASRSLDAVYSLTQCEHRRYASLGIDSPLLRWGCHPELLHVQADRPRDETVFFYPGGYLSRRKPTEAVINAFLGRGHHRARLIVKTQDASHDPALQRLARGDSRILICSDDLPSEQYNSLFASAHVCLAPSRWEGLGLHLYEATAFGMPIITNDNPPMNEIVRDDDNGALVRSTCVGQTPSGIDSFDPDVDDLMRAIDAACDHSTLERWQAGAIRRRDELAWPHTILDFQDLLLQTCGSNTSIGAGR